MATPRTGRTTTGRTNTGRSSTGSATGRRRLLNMQNAGRTPRVVSQPAPESQRGAFGKTQLSRTSPLRSVLLDPAVNNLPPARTHSEYAGFVKNRNRAHRSYDLDGDGQVSQDDYKLAASLDIHGTGRLNEAQCEEGRYVHAERFFERQTRNVKLLEKRGGGRPAGHGRTSLLGSERRNFAACPWTQRGGTEGHRENAQRLARSPAFAFALRSLETREKTLLGRASSQMTACMSVPSEDWGGPRSDLLAARKRTERLFGQAQLDRADAQREKFSSKRVCPISDMAFENG